MNDYYFIVYGLTIISIIITVLAQLFVKSTFKKFSKIKNKKGLSGKEAAREILDKNGLNNIKIEHISGSLTDHYDPSNKVVRLSNDVYDKETISALSVACHECGHAIQDKKGYIFLTIRSKIIPIVNIASYAGYISIMLGLISGFINLIMIGIIAQIVILLFQLLTLPVEINASKRALKELKKYNLLDKKELKSGRRVLVSAALTYVASVATTLIQILRLLLMFRRRK